VKHTFADASLLYKDATGAYYYAAGPVKEYEYECIRQQIGCIVKAILKHTHKRFSMDLEFGGRVYYKIVTQGNIDLNLEYKTTNRHDMFSGFYLTRWNYWMVMPFLNVKLGRLF
jgi:hypothetical protein